MAGNAALQRLFARTQRGSLNISGGALDEDNLWNVGGANSEESATGWKQRDTPLHADTFEKPSNFLQEQFDSNFGGDEPQTPETVQPLNTENYNQAKKLFPVGQSRSGADTYDAPKDFTASSQPSEELINYGFGRWMEDDNSVSSDYPKQPESVTAAPIEQKPKSKSAQMLDEINAAQEAPIKKEKSFGKRLGSGLWNAIKIWGASGGQGGLAGLVGALATGGIGFALSPDLQGDFKKQQNVGKLWNQYGTQVKAEDAQNDLTYKQTQTQNIIDDNQRAENEFGKRMDYLNSEQQRKIDDRTSRERTSRMTQVAGMFKNLPSYDPNDPKFAEITKALGDVNLPITPKDAKKKVDLKQDQRTGEWTVILTNPLDGKQEVRTVVKDGKPLRTTPTVVMQGEFGLLKQNDQQEFTATQNDINRKETLRKWVIANKVNRAKFKADLDAKVAAGNLSQTQADAALADFPEDIN